ncbi:Mur ligase family protein [uncultured Methanobrevibacter sp.]|uniref:Mur ligase family protein n=1 Tax=uncultured Methanobrevibacter sp. TaxID=253161 RepID=UPI0026264549
MQSLELSGMSDEELKSLPLEGKTFGVIGVCGVVGNLVARILMDNGYSVVGTDISSRQDCRFHSSFKDYDIEIFFGGHPEEFFKRIDYIVPPPSMNDNAKVLKLASQHNIDIIHLGDIFRLFKPNKPVLCISGTNGKTTTTTLLKHIAYTAGINPSEHNLEGMQGNNEFIPSLQTRLHGDVAILETGTDGAPGGLKSVIDLTHPDYAILTNITIDHLVDPDAHGNENSIVDNENSIVENADDDLDTNVSHVDRGFLEYARVKGELAEGIEENQGTLIFNSDDPTIIGLLDKINYTGEKITFGIELNENYESDNSNVGSVYGDELSSEDICPNDKDHHEFIHRKPCWCGREIKINETISGSGYYECECGIGYEKPDYIAYDIDLKNREFSLKSDDDDECRFKLSLDGLHNVYNALGAIIAAKIFLGLSNEEIQKGLSSFKGVDGRMDIVGSVDGKTIMVDYAHNPAGVETILHEISKLYDKTAVVITVSSESGIEGDLDILDSALGNVDYIVPASHDSRYAVDRLIEASYDNRQEELNLSGEYSIEQLEKTFILGDDNIEQMSVKTLGASQDQVIEGLLKALDLDCDIVLIIGEAAFKFKSAIIDFCNGLD